MSSSALVTISSDQRDQGVAYATILDMIEATVAHSAAELSVANANNRKEREDALVRFSKKPRREKEAKSELVRLLLPINATMNQQRIEEISSMTNLTAPFKCCQKKSNDGKNNIASHLYVSSVPIDQTNHAKKVWLVTQLI